MLLLVPSATYLSICPLKWSNGPRAVYSDTRVVDSGSAVCGVTGVPSGAGAASFVPLVRFGLDYCIVAISSAPVRFFLSPRASAAPLVGGVGVGMERVRARA